MAYQYTVKAYNGEEIKEYGYNDIRVAESFMSNAEEYDDIDYIELFNHKGDCLKSYAV